MPANISGVYTPVPSLVLEFWDLQEGLGIRLGTDEQWSRRAQGWLGYVGDEILPTYIGIIFSNYKDPY